MEEAGGVAELGEGAVLDDAALVEDGDLVGDSDVGQPVGDQEDGAVGGEFAKTGEDAVFGAGVQRYL